MKKTTLTLFITLLFFNCIIAQKGATEEIKDAISEEFNEWLKKSDYETNADYEKRVKTESEDELKKITNETTIEIKKKKLSFSFFDVGQYDAENSIFPLLIYNRHCNNCYDYPKLLQTLNLEVNRNIAKGFAEKFNIESDVYKIIFPTDLEIINNQWLITKAFVLFSDQLLYINDFSYKIDDKFQLILEENNKRFTDYKAHYTFQQVDFLKMLPYDNYLNYYTKWDIKTQPNYTSSSESKPISFSLEDLNITLPATLTSNASNTIAKSQETDLDIFKVQTINSNPNAVAVVIGNKDYENTKKVSYAINDATEIKKYLVNALGYSESNIIYIENAKKSNFDILFGTNDNPEGKLFNSIKQGESDVFVYYSGHGAPGLKDNKGYFVPVDCDTQYIEHTAYSLDLFYKNLAKLNAKSVTVVTDACFSGAELFKNISPITITVSNPIVLTPNCVVLSSSTGSQVSSWFNDKNHGLFTYFFLRALQEKDKSDANKDNKLTFKEIADYVSDKTQGVPSLARKLHNVDQNPTIQGTGVENVFVEYK